MAKTKTTDEPEVQTPPFEITREAWDALVARVDWLEQTLERFTREYKHVHRTVQQINYQFSEQRAKQEANR